MSHKEESFLPLTSIKEGEEAVIRRISAGGELLSRFAALGLVVGVTLRMVRNSSRGLIILQVSESRIALGQGEAKNIFVEKAAPLSPLSAEPPHRKEIRVALAGQPNVGKSTLFNILTGLSQHVGNWHGKTVERKDGTYNDGDVTITIVDLPGTYSLSSRSEEERIARDYMMSDDVEAIVVVANAAALERGLYILAETLLLSKPVIFVLNMFDLAQKAGIGIDCAALEEELGIPVVPMVATKNQGIRELVTRISAIARDGFWFTPTLPQVAIDHHHEFRKVRELVLPHLPPQESAIWASTKLMEGDTEITARVSAYLPPEKWLEIQSLLMKHEDALQAVLNGRYKWLETVMKRSVARFRMGQMTLTDKVDKYLTRPVFGIPALIVFFAITFLAANVVGIYLQGIISDFLANRSQVLVAWLAGAPSWVSGLLVNGVIGGVGLVLTFLPVLAVFFAMLALFENVGYMARAAFVMDRFMHIVGLHGKSFLPLCIGLGCNVPAVMGARILETQRERWLTIFLAPFIPCSPRFAVLALIVSALFGGQAIFIFPALIALNFLVLLLVGIIANKSFANDGKTHFIMELPVYQMPHLKTILVNVWTRIVQFLKRAGTLILASAILVWLVSYLPGGTIEDSYLAMAGKALEPLGAPLGFDWKMITAVLMSTAAKENAVAALGILHSTGGVRLENVLPMVMSKASALSFMTVIMLWIPCFATMAVMVRELGRIKIFLMNIVLMGALAYGAGFVVYQCALFFQ